MAEATTLPNERVSLVRRVLDSSTLYRILALAIFAGLWQLATYQGKSMLIPTFVNTAAAIPELLVGDYRGDLWTALFNSNQAMIVGLMISIVVGIPLGLLIGRFRRIERFANLYISILLVTPMAAVDPAPGDVAGRARRRLPVTGHPDRALLHRDAHREQPGRRSPG